VDVERTRDGMSDAKLGTALWRGRYLVLLAVVSTLAAAVLATVTSTKVYRASTMLQVELSAPAASAAGSNPDQANQTLASADATVIGSRSFLQRVRREVAGGRYSAAELQSQVAAKAVKDTNLVSLTAEAGSPAAARRLAGDVARAFVGSIAADAGHQTARAEAQIQQRIQTLNNRIQVANRSLSSGRLSSQARETLSQQVTSLQLARSALTQQLAGILGRSVANGDSVTLTGPPTASSTPVRPRTALNLMAGLLLGLVIGVALAWLRARLDTTVRSAAEGSDVVGAPVLATIPLVRQPDADDPVLSDAYDVFHTNLTLRARSLRVVVLASRNAGEGKTSAALGLAQATARAGKEVLLVDGDLRTRQLSVMLGYGSAIGLSDALAEGHFTTAELGSALRLLPAGDRPPNITALLYGPVLRELVSQLREEYDLVVIDTPPMGSLPDASIVGSLADGIVVIGRVGMTKQTDLAAASANLADTGTPLLGAVILQRRRVRPYQPPGWDSSSGRTRDAALKL
jgi:capsular exopolysaccharide synthesis family protein